MEPQEINMKKTLTSIFVLLILNACSQKQTTLQKFIPDTTINNELKLVNSKSIEKAIGNQSGKLVDDEKASRIQLANVNNDEYMILYHLSGSNANSFNEFEIGILKTNSGVFKSTHYKSFSSESKIKLGMLEEDLTRIKGGNYTKDVKDGFTVVNYKITDSSDSFLKNYNMPLYKAQYYFKDGKLTKFIFGFPNL